MRVAIFDESSQYRHSAGLVYETGEFSIIGAGLTTREHVAQMDEAGELVWLSADVRKGVIAASYVESVAQTVVTDAPRPVVPQPSVGSGQGVGAAASAPLNPTPPSGGSYGLRSLTLDVAGRILMVLVAALAFIEAFFIGGFAYGLAAATTVLLVLGSCLLPTVVGCYGLYRWNGKRILSRTPKGRLRGVFGLNVWLMSALVVAGLVAGLVAGAQGQKGNTGQVIPPSSVVVNGKTYPVIGIKNVSASDLQRGDTVDVEEVSGNDGTVIGYNITGIETVAGGK
jgi:hypothetical protein